MKRRRLDCAEYQDLHRRVLKRDGWRCQVLRKPQPSYRFTTSSHVLSSARISRKTSLRFATNATEQFISIFNVDCLFTAH